MARTKKLLIGIAVAAVVLATFGHAESMKGARPLANDVPSKSAITGKVFGVFRRACARCDRRLKSFIRTDHVWCGWQAGKVLVHVTMRNTSARDLIVYWHPSYVLARGGERGQGLSSIESGDFDAHERRRLLAKANPKGVRDGSRISACKPSFALIVRG